MGFMCCVCIRKSENDGAHERLLAKLSKSSSTAFEAFLASQYYLVKKTMEFAYGDGWAEQCPCRRCPQEWLNLGWICPIDFHKRWYLRILDERFYAAGYSHLQARDLDLDWDILVARLHDELYVIFDDVIFDDGRAAG